MSMHYYRIFESADEKIIGVYPQISNAVYLSTYDSPNALGMLAFEKAKPTTEVPKGVLSKKAKLTDLLSVSFLSGQLFISNKLENIFQEYSKEGIEFIATSLIIDKKVNPNFFIVNPFLSNCSYLDVASCSFVYTDAFGKNELESVKFDSTDSFIRAFLQNRKDAVDIGYPNHKPLMFKKIAFKKDCSIDFFSVPAVSNGYIGYFVSSSLKNQIERAGCNGIIFEEPNERNF